MMIETKERMKKKVGNGWNEKERVGEEDERKW